MKDGFHFQFVFGSGVFFVGLFSLFLCHFNQDLAFEVSLYPKGMLTGSLWSMANAMTVPIVQNLGLGPGFSTWNCVNVLGTYVIGRLAILGLNYEASASPLCGLIGILVGITGLVLFGRLKPKEEEDLDQSLLGEKAKRNPKLGFSMAVIAGIAYAFNFVPLKLHLQNLQDRELAKSTAEALRFSFSNMTGIFFCSLVIFASYLCRNGEQSQFLEPKSWLPSLLSGIIWAVSSFSASVATAELGLTIGFPVLANSAFLVNNFLSYFVFKEISGKRNTKLFLIANVLVLLSSILLALSAP